jgi:phosphatidylserine decarboxylase
MNRKSGHYELIAREGYPFFIPLFAVSIVLWIADYNISSLIFLIFGSFVLYFFRNPERKPPVGEGLIISPADGRVVQIVENTSSNFLSDFPLTRISIFMSVFDVHVNRWPMSGIVKKITHVPGRFMDARHPEASYSNEHNSIVLTSEQSAIEVVQIAGKIARRIACWVEEGDSVVQGERFGLIRFGSRLDVYLPPKFTITVNLGTRVTAGESILAVKKQTNS